MAISIRSTLVAAAIGAATLLGGCIVGPGYGHGYGYGYNGYYERGGDRREWRDGDRGREYRDNDRREWRRDRDGDYRGDRDRDGRRD